MINFSAIGGVAILFMVAAVLFRDKFILLCMVGVVVVALLIIIHLAADFYWYNKDRGW